MSHLRHAHLLVYHSVSILSRTISPQSGDPHLAVVIPFSPADATIDRLVELVTPDMQRVNAADSDAHRAPK